MLPLGLQIYNKKVLRKDSIWFVVVVQRIILNGTLDAFLGIKKTNEIEAINVSKLKLQLSTRNEYRGIVIKNSVEMQVLTFKINLCLKIIYFENN